MSTHSGMAEFLKRSMASQSQKQLSPLPPNGKFSFGVNTTFQWNQPRTTSENQKHSRKFGSRNNSWEETG